MRSIRLPGYGLTLRQASAACLALFALLLTAACGSDSGQSPTSPPGTQLPTATATATTSPSTSPTAVASSTAAVSPTAQATATVPPATGGEGVLIGVGNGGGQGSILVDGEGMTIYVFDNDTAGVSNCTGSCLAAWPPVTTDGEPEAGDGVTAQLGTITRTDGTKQVTVNGFPAYHFASDSAPGDIKGHAVNNTWWVFGPDGKAKRPAASDPYDYEYDYNY